VGAAGAVSLGIMGEDVVDKEDDSGGEMPLEDVVATPMSGDRARGDEEEVWGVGRVMVSLGLAASSSSMLLFRADPLEERLSFPRSCGDDAEDKRVVVVVAASIESGEEEGE